MKKGHIRFMDNFAVKIGVQVHAMNQGVEINYLHEVDPGDVMKNWGNSSTREYPSISRQPFPPIQDYFAGKN